MPVQFDVPQPTDVIDALNKWNAWQKGRVASKYAEPMAQSNLEKLKAITQGQNISNQGEQIKLPFIAPEHQSGLEKLKAEIARTNAETGKYNAETNLMPKKYDIEQGNLDLNKQKFSPSQLDTIQRLREAMIRSKSLSNMSLDENGLPITQGEPAQQNAPSNPFDPNQATQQSDNQQSGNQGSTINQPGDQGLSNLPKKTKEVWTPSPIGMTSRGAPTMYQNKRTGETLIPFTPAIRTQVLNQRASMDIVIPKIRKLIEYGTKSILGAPNSFGNNIIDPNLRADYESTLNDIKDSSMSSMKLPKVREAMHSIDSINKRYPGETADHYKDRANRLISTIQGAKDDVDYYLSKGGYIIHANGSPSERAAKKTEGQASQQFPTFKNKQEFDQWKSQASPEILQAYKQHLHG